MRKIGITGGIGSGKTEIINYIREHHNARVIVADQVAHNLEAPGQECYQKLLDAFGIEILDKDGRIDKKSFAEVIFMDNRYLQMANEIIHPAVKNYILEAIREEEKKKTPFFILEAALLIEEGYMSIIDEIWYIYADESIRRARLKESRGYSDEKIDSIMMNQMSEDEFRMNCEKIITNNTSVEDVKKLIDEALGEQR